MKKPQIKKFIDKKLKKIKYFSKKRDNQFILLGFFFLILQVFVFLGNYNSERYDVFFWFCNHTPLFFSLAFFMKKYNIIKGIINVGFIGQFAWTLDFIGKLFFDFHIFKMTNYVFENPNGLWILVPIGIHIFSTNLALYFTRDKKPNIYTAFYSLIYILFLYAGTLTYTLAEKNVNWIFEIGGELNFSHPAYTPFWPILVFFILAIPTQGIQHLIYKWTKKTKQQKRKENN